MNIYLLIIVLSLIVAFGLNTLAGLLGAAHQSLQVPKRLRELLSKERYDESRRYSLMRTRADIVEEASITGLILAAILLGWFEHLDQATRSLGLGPIGTGLAFFLLLGLVVDLVHLPFAIHRTFVLEARFGFNTTTWTTFLTDKLKGWMVVCALGGPLLAALIAFFTAAGSLAWVWCWLAVTVFMIFSATLAPVLILPLFNRFTPLKPGELRESIERMAREAGFKVSGIFVMDGSKRSTKANAFFTGLGSTKRIALYDTLVQSQTTGEITAVLAHEIGHSRLGHIRTRLVVGIAKAGAMLWMLSLLLSSHKLYEAFGVSQMSVHAGLVFFALLATPLGLVASVVSGAVSRRHEYAADRYAARLTGRPQDLASALAGLAVKNLSELTPHPLQVWLHYSHPPVLERLARLDQLADLESQVRDRSIPG